MLGTLWITKKGVGYKITAQVETPYGTLYTLNQLGTGYNIYLDLKTLNIFARQLDN